MAKALELFEPVAAAVPHAAAPLNIAPAAAPIIIPFSFSGAIAQPEPRDSTTATPTPSREIFLTLTLSVRFPPN
jgi:hypothetical protein